MTDTAPDRLHLEDDGTFPNNGLPVLLWRSAILTNGDTASAIEDRFHANGWGGSWRNGIFTYHHYHSTAAEVLGIARGSVTIQLGGPSGETLDLAAGDIALLPAGTAHKNLGQSDDLLVIGAYPPGQRPDMLRGEPDERPEADQNIATVPLPATDPVTGDDGPPPEWRRARS
ncbi:MAG TPA: hypothetical protein VGR22_07420 [Thermomicrobiales bacterium]|nr:hypothetical protein [Thermomicrobiales bacterium]